MKKLSLSLALLGLCIAVSAQNNGGISSGMLSELSASYDSDLATNKVVRNALNTTGIAALAANAANAAMIDTHFSDKVKTKGITDQKQSGRCWLFSGLNFLRAEVIGKHDLGDFQFSQSYCFFYDQLEKANLFLQAVIDTRLKPMDDREVDWLFQHPLSDGGTFTGVANLISKYGLVPADIMPESLSANNTRAMSEQLRTLLRKDGLLLRRHLAGYNASQTERYLQRKKTEMLKDVYRILALCLGEPPAQFEWTMYNSKGEKVSTKSYTPVEFYNEMVGLDLNNGYVMLMNDPTRAYGEVYEIQYDRHQYDGQNWRHVNLPVERIKEMAIASIKGGKAMYFSCDVAKFLNRSKGVLDLNNYDYNSLLGVDLSMNKEDRVKSYASGSSHAMMLMAVDIQDGRPVKWMVENSWGAKSGYKGCLIMTDRWFEEYMFRLVVEKQFVPADVMKMLDKKAIMLPAWDPMYASEQ